MYDSGFEKFQICVYEAMHVAMHVIRERSSTAPVACDIEPYFKVRHDFHCKFYLRLVHIVDDHRTRLECDTCCRQVDLMNADDLDIS